MTVVYLVKAVLQDRKSELHTTLLLVKNVEELRTKLSNLYNCFEIYSDMEEEVPDNILQQEGADSYEMYSHQYNDCRMLLEVYDKIELP